MAEVPLTTCEQPSTDESEPTAVIEQPPPAGDASTDGFTGDTGATCLGGQTLGPDATPAPLSDEAEPQSTAESEEPSSPVVEMSPVADEETQPTAEPDPPLSKRQRKRLAKREAFLAQRPAMRRAERQRRKERRAAAAAAGAPPPKRPRLAPMSSGSDVRVVIDLSFDDLMTERDLGKCLKQVQRCYAANRRATRPVQLMLTGMEGESRRLMDANDGWQNWDVRIERESVLDVLPRETVTYLTSDSEHELDTLQPGRAYVIGGLVDHNHHKGECLRRATEAGISHARLPIDHFVEMKTRKVLTIDHVFSILLLVAGGAGWSQALQQVLPARKGAVVKGEAECHGGENGVEDKRSEVTERGEREIDEGMKRHENEISGESARGEGDSNGEAEENMRTGEDVTTVMESDEAKAVCANAEPGQGKVESTETGQKSAVSELMTRPAVGQGGEASGSQTNDEALADGGADLTNGAGRAMT